LETSNRRRTLLYQALVHDFCPRFRGDIAPQIDIKFTGVF
jgi:hypothetical protein